MTRGKKISSWLAVTMVTTMCLLLPGCGGTPNGEPSAGAKPSSADSETVAFSWTADSDCSTCHAGESSSMEDLACQAAKGHSGMPCASCHTDESGLASAHAKVTLADTEGAKKLSKTEVSETACISCHADAGSPEATVGVTALTDDKGTTVNPHALPANASHETVQCSDCHTMHESKTIEESAQAACAQCHHQDVYECYTCHE